MSDREIKTLADALAYLKPDPANNGTISLRAPKARQAVEMIEASIAALRAQDREDGAREMRERAIRAAKMWPLGCIPTAQQADGRNAAAAAIRALPLSPARKEDGDA